MNHVGDDESMAINMTWRCDGWDEWQGESGRRRSLFKAQDERPARNEVIVSGSGIEHECHEYALEYTIDAKAAPRLGFFNMVLVLG